MHYEFPTITHFDDIEHAIDENFIVAHRNGHKIVNYKYAHKDTFPDIDENDPSTAIRREFRGLIFDDAGNIIRRPFHKFFNIGERSDTSFDTLNFNNLHVIYEKLDGSMIAPYRVGIDLIWGTKLGDTDIADQVHKFLDDSEKKQNYMDFANRMIDLGYTPIFEWLSPKNRIVIESFQDNLVLTAIRNMEDGTYMSDEDMEMYADEHDIPLCDVRDAKTFTKAYMDTLRDEEDSEGVVVRFMDGHMVKLKTNWYVKLHRIKSDLAFERGVVDLILSGNADDIKPILIKGDLDRFEEYEKAFMVAYAEEMLSILDVLESIKKDELTRKEWAVNHMPKHPSYVSSIVFKNWDMYYDDFADKRKMIPLVREQFHDIIHRMCSKNSKFDTFRESAGLFSNVPKWSYVTIGE